MPMLRKKPRRRRVFSITSLIPNMLTVLALCAGMTSIRFALQGDWKAAVAAGFIAAILDGLDGRMARLLKSASKFGAELDSLSDFIAFGVAPGIIIYLWSGGDLGNIGWIASLAYATCAALRLARFNTMLEDPDRPAWTSNYFDGVAAPLGATLVALPMVMSFLFGDAFFRHPIVNIVWLLTVGFLMISHIPTYSFKRARVKREYVVPTLVTVAVGAAILITYPWAGLAAIGWGYLALMPFSYISHRRLSQKVPDTKHRADALDLVLDSIEEEDAEEEQEH
jgi:CDP-diacylglycerol--serine O-phosphatidyltransferase